MGCNRDRANETGRWAVCEQLEPRRLLSGEGLRGEYFDDIDLTISKLVRTDAAVDFNWGTSAPAAGVGADTFSVRWTGKLNVPTTGTYTFFTTTDDGVRLWVNKQLVIDKWQDQGGTEWSSSGIALAAGQQYHLQMEYYENGYGAQAALKWSGPGIAKQVIPQSAMSLPDNTGSITGNVWWDYYENGVRDHSQFKQEGPVSGSSYCDIRLTRIDVPTIFLEAELDEEGNYRFDNLPAGSYTVEFIRTDEQFRSTYPGDWTGSLWDVVLSPGQLAAGRDFGMGDGGAWGDYGWNSLSATPGTLSSAGGTLNITRSFFYVSSRYNLGSYPIRYSLSRDQIRSGDDVPVAATDETGDSYDANSTGSINGTVGAIAPGSYYLLGFLDPPDGRPPEWTGTNNVIVGPQINVPGPDLTMARPAGWPDKMVIATRTGTIADDTVYYSTQNIFLDFTVANIGQLDAVASSTQLWIDGVLKASFATNALGAGAQQTFLDQDIGKLAVGTHTIQLRADGTGGVTEFSETNNNRTRTITVLEARPDLTLIQPAGWPDKMVISTVRKDHVNAGSISRAQDIYLDFVVSNTGPVAAGPSTVYLYIDGVLSHGLLVPALSSGAQYPVNDWNIGKLSAGTHTLKLTADGPNGILEAIEGNNNRTRTITVLA